MKKRFISFILVLFILTSLIPKPIEAKGFVKEIDVIDNNFKFNLEGKNIYSKEAFVYDGELWVPLKDLGKALGLGVDFNSTTRTFKLNSNGKLHIDDTSNANVAFQRGYEIQAKERKIKELDKEISSFQGRNFSGDSKADFNLKNISVGFSNINILLDGKKLNLDIEPLIYNDDLYVSLVALSPSLFITPSLNGNVINIDSNSVLIKKPGYDSVDDLAKFRDSLNNRLGVQLAEMEKRKEILMDVKIPYENIKTLPAMEKYINKHLDKISELPVSVKLRSASDSWYYLDIDFSNSHYHLWRDLSRRDVEAYIWDIFVAITSLYDDNAKIQGNIKKYVSFDTKLKDITFSFINSNLDMSGKVDTIFIEDLLAKKLGRYYNEYFDFSARMSGHDLELLVTPRSSDYMKKWSPDSKLRFLRQIDYIIKDHYPGLKVNGRIEYPGEDTIHFLIDGGKLSSSNIIDEMVNYLNKSYSVFRANGLQIPMKYGFHKVDQDNYKLMVYMDFDRNDPKWDQATEEALGSFLQDIIKEIVSLWDVNILAQAYDKNQDLVSEFFISLDTVQAVTANPVSGDIEEGKSVSLSTNTPNADIYYTIDGSNPSENNRIKYSNSIVINKNTTIKAYAVKDGLKDSPLYEFKYKLVASGNIATGLDGLIVSEGKLDPSFSKDLYDYKLSLPSSIFTIGIRARASKGSITINGESAISGSIMDVDLKVGHNQIKIKHKEEGKDDRVYTIQVTVAEEDSSESDVRLDPGYKFNTFADTKLFAGKLISSSVSDFTGYQVSITSSVPNKVYDTVSVNSDGSFQTKNFPIDSWEKLLGYKYKIIDAKGELIFTSKDNLRIQ